MTAISTPPAPAHGPRPSAPAAQPDRAADRAALAERFEQVRAFSEAICEPLETEDYVLQTMEDASPPKWHLAHTAWFFERFILAQHDASYTPVHPQYDYLFNSYYNAVGPMHCRPNRGHISRPTVEQVYDYRRIINRRLLDALPTLSDELARRVELGLHHEQQHQELLITDIKHHLSTNPMLPAYADTLPDEADGGRVDDLKFRDFAGGLVEIGLDAGDAAFSYDNESPRHRVFLEPFALATGCITNAEFAAFIADGGYERHELWLSLGWSTVKQHGWTHPLYWYRDPQRGDAWLEYTLAGPRPLRSSEPVSHLSYFEADAYARWAGARLPTEAEWEHAAVTSAWEAGRFAEDAIDQHAAPHPGPVADLPHGFDQLFGGLWEWTSSSYNPYPGYTAPPGALGEYNGKFMCNQYVLRGGSCATPRSHLRATYRNFFSPAARWQFTGLRLAR